MKPIETIYKGYKFRSRLEARWAVFFDQLGLQWDYEPEGYDLGDGIFYLPDFRVKYPGINNKDSNFQWFEVKGDISKLSIKECEKIIKFGSNEQITILDGVPRTTVYTSIVPENGKSILDLIPIEAKDLQYFFTYLSDLDPFYRNGVSLWSKKRKLWWSGHLDFFENSIHDDAVKDIYFACFASRSARFEHGQSPE